MSLVDKLGPNDVRLAGVSAGDMLLELARRGWNCDLAWTNDGGFTRFIEVQLKHFYDDRSKGCDEETVLGAFAQAYYKWK